MLTTALTERAQRVMLLILTVIAVTAALQLGQQVLAPIVFALVVGIVVSPLAERLTGLGVPRVGVAMLLLLVTTSLIALLVLMVEPLLDMFIRQLPRLKAGAARWIASVSDVLRGIETISKEIEGAKPGADDGAASALPSVRDALWMAPNFGAQFFIFVGTLFFFVLTRNDLYGAVGELEPKLRKADRAVARYFAAVTLVNAGLGALTAAIMLAIGVEYPMLWGLAAAILNYMLYLGPLLIIAGLTIAGLLQFTGAMSLLPPALYLVVNFTEANFVTPWVVGQRLAMNPLGVFVAIVFGLWLWGPVGAIVALPVMLWLGVLLRPTMLQMPSGPGAPAIG
ncbi:AI-2E family transporter [Mameliella alba]|nr:AI-2E family transporter [Antarctobacter heliothermus]MBY6143719.1 AI-2E family transporter [Mameliella alba]MCA0952557.1 AI-2E family transporter [Mameliella alba]